MGKEDILFNHSGRKKEEDVKYVRDMSGEELTNIVFTRSIARRIHFYHVKFNFCVFDSCYFRDCVFDSCDFTGCKFVGSNLNGTKFIDCKLLYAIFERVIVDFESLVDSLPKEENLRAKLLRTLRVNFQQQGDSLSVNKVISLELDATKAHLKKSWMSGEEYYRKKYQGLERVRKFLEWTVFKFLDMVWGNGESVAKLFRTTIFILIIISINEVYHLTDKNNFNAILNSFLISPSVFFGVVNTKNYHDGMLTLILFLRLIIFGLFMSIVIKRISRR